MRSVKDLLLEYCTYQCYRLCEAKLTLTSTNRVGMVPRPFSPAFHGAKPNDRPELNYVDITHSKDGEKYTFVLRDKHSDYK